MHTIESRAIFVDEATGVQVEQVPIGSRAFEQVRMIRGLAARGEGASSDVFDLNADIYLLYSGDLPVATLRVNHAQRSAFDCEEFYPASFVNEFRPFIASTSRFAKIPSLASSVGLMHLFMREVWVDQIRKGIRIDLINAHQPMIPYYLRIGYSLLCNSFFVHPRLSTPSFVMIGLGDPRLKSPISEAFREVAEASFFFNYVTSKISFCVYKSCTTFSACQDSQTQRFVCDNA